jgi:dsDNA-specific endonuclease/ATPase MutS2
MSRPVPGVAKQKLAANADKIEKLKEKIAEQEGDWQEQELALLADRVQQETVEVPLGKGKGSIRLKACLSDAEMQAIVALENRRKKVAAQQKQLQKARAELEKKAELEPVAESVWAEQDAQEQKARDEVEDIAFTILEKVTANEKLTREFFKTQRHKYSTQDLLTITLGWQKLMGERAQATVKMASFR